MKNYRDDDDDERSERDRWGEVEENERQGLEDGVDVEDQYDHD
jgi:hypothetical protein